MRRALLDQTAPAIEAEDRGETWEERVWQAVEGACDCLLAAQQDDGHWCAELEGDTILESEYLLCLTFLGIDCSKKLHKAANYLRSKQGEDGGWASSPGGSADVSISVKAYLVLKLAGDDPQSNSMRRARERILALGGIEACNSFTKIYLAIFGQYPWSRCPAVPPEIILLPKWFYCNIYAMSAWTRTIVVPLSVIWAFKPSAELPKHSQIPELRGQLRGPSQAVATAAESWRARLWGIFFRGVDRVFHGLEAVRFRPWRQRALAACEAWILPRLKDSDGLGAIFPPIINTLIAFRCLGYTCDHPVIRQQLHELEKLEIEESDSLRLQPCLSPVWDTTLALAALQEAGFDSDRRAVRQAARWLLSKEVRKPGDRQLIDSSTPVGGWYFEYANEFYPDCDDTAEVLKSVSSVRFEDPEEEQQRRASLDRGLAWLRSMQNRDGGWGAFDRGCDRETLTYVPFADHNAMIDPSTADITSRCILALRAHGFEPGAEEIRNARGFLRRDQEADGSWYGRWGCNYLYGTWLALTGLQAAGDPEDQEAMRRAAGWIRRCQNDDGGWGELTTSYDDPVLKGEGPSTASQTAWALMGLFATEDFDSDTVRRGVGYLLERQRAEGDWYDEPWTGTGFPKVFYLRYHFYATYFPLEALAIYERHLGQAARRGIHAVSESER